MGFEGSYIWRLRQLIGSQLVLGPGAVVVPVAADGRVLLLHRPDFDAWGLPSGSVEPGTTFAETAAAELREESGLVVDVADLEPFACLSDPQSSMVTFPNGDRVHSFNVCFIASAWRGELRPDGEEAIDADFFALDDLPQPLLPYTTGTLALLRAYRATAQFQAG